MYIYIYIYIYQGYYVYCLWVSISFLDCHAVFIFPSLLSPAMSRAGRRRKNQAQNDVEVEQVRAYPDCANLFPATSFGAAPAP